jgi:MoaA/NifB/PqqE/SkfB family radical SAM enzyme
MLTDPRPSLLAGTRLPPSVCLRVTRACNARCGFCLAPPSGHGVSFESIVGRLRWLAELGIGKVNLSGGEPTIRRDLPEIVGEVRRLGLVSAMTTNGILLSSDLLTTLQESATRVKVSVHGGPELHDAMLGRRCFDQVDTNVGRLVSAGVPTAVQCVVTRRRVDVAETLIDYCTARGVRKLRFVPFVPRGRGLQFADDFQLSAEERERVTTEVRAARVRLRGVLDVDLLDFWVQEYVVLETNGELQIQRETDAADSTVASVD